MRIMYSVRRLLPSTMRGWFAEQDEQMCPDEASAANANDAQTQTDARTVGLNPMLYENYLSLELRHGSTPATEPPLPLQYTLRWQIKFVDGSSHGKLHRYADFSSAGSFFNSFRGFSSRRVIFSSGLLWAAQIAPPQRTTSVNFATTRNRIAGVVKNCSALTKTDERIIGKFNSDPD